MPGSTSTDPSPRRRASSAGSSRRTPCPAAERETEINGPLAAATGVGLFLVVVVLTIARPRGLPEWASGVGGAVVAVVVGLVGPDAAVAAVVGDANVLAFFVGMTGLAAVAERSGFFEQTGALAVRWSAGSGRRLLLAVLCLGAAISMVLSNDATVLILTPVVYGLVVGLGVDALPYVLACTFIADAASLLLPVSNPVNVLILDGVGVPVPDYLAAVGPAAVVAVALTIVALMWLFRLRVPRRLRHATASFERRPLPAVWIALGGVAVTFVGGGLLGAPLGLVACVGFVFLLVVEALAAGAAHRRPLDGVSWAILAYVAGMVVLVRALEDQGVVQALVGTTLSAGRDSPAVIAILSTAVAAVGANLVNNVPMALVMVSAIDGTHLAGPVRQAAAFGSIVGADLGPNLTTVGSLATVLWLLILRDRGMDVRPADYLRVGLLITPPILVASTAVLVATLTVR
ncbi:MAG: hypothetical protein IVW53_09245 [Chloroflexi bacterium]|nr:hypothetical protein [Chloroflexota bacterium]